MAFKKATKCLNKDYPPSFSTSARFYQQAAYMQSSCQPYLASQPCPGSQPCQCCLERTEQKAHPQKMSDLFGSNVFNDTVMQQRLPADVYKSLKKTIEFNTLLDANIADVVASSMKDWAIERGATHFAHVFYPLNGLTAEKHDAFLVPDGNGGAIVEFSGKLLFKGEQDASSFPSGGLRHTFEARGYTTWDVTSPVYLYETPAGCVLCIPTAFVSYTGEALDKKTPLLRSNQVLGIHAARILQLFGTATTFPITSFAGVEQEYFLVDKELAYARPDLVICGRTLCGARPAKGQEFEDQYFGVVPHNVLAFMGDVEHELCKLGVPIKTRHNETAPRQFELAPLFESGNLATDHNQMIMVVLQREAKKHGMLCLLHEKPFAGINGSGKHLNYSLGNRDLGSLFDPGETPQDNMQFLVFCAAMIRGLHKHGAFLRATVATAGNDHRLGAQEAPPAIMSVYLGTQLASIFEQIRTGAASAGIQQKKINLGVTALPPFAIDLGDRNRTSPFAFVGNRFEFRTVGSDMSISGAQVVLNTILAESLDYIATQLEAVVAEDPSPVTLASAVQLLLKDIIEKHRAIIFDGDGYSQEWVEEAARRGLPNLRTSPEALPAFTYEETIELCKKYNVLSLTELQSRQEIYTEQYCKSIRTEARVLAGMCKTQILPATVRYQTELATACKQLAELGLETQFELLKTITISMTALHNEVAMLEQALEKHLSTLEDAAYVKETVLTSMLKVRTYADHLETLVADDLWPFPKYQEMLFYH